MLEKEYALYDSRRGEFLAEHAGEYVVIKGDRVVGFFTSERAALEAMKSEQLGTFLVQQCQSIDAETARYASRVVAFA